MRIFAGELAGLGDIAAAAAAAGFAGLAGSMTTGQLRAALKAMVLWLDPAAARRRAGHGRCQAGVEAWQENSGNGALAGRELPAADAVAADKRLTAIARALQDAGAPGDLDQLRAAVFAALLAGRPAADLLLPRLPAARRPRRPGPHRPLRPGGRTSERNLSSLCRMHHWVKHARGWTLTQPEPGVPTWTAPQGRSYTVTPEPYLV